MLKMPPKEIPCLDCAVNGSVNCPKHSSLRKVSTDVGVVDINELATEIASAILWPHYENNSAAFKQDVANHAQGIASALRAVRDAERARVTLAVRQFEYLRDTVNQQYPLKRNSNDDSKYLLWLSESLSTAIAALSAKGETK